MAAGRAEAAVAFRSHGGHGRDGGFLPNLCRVMTIPRSRGKGRRAARPPARPLRDAPAGPRGSRVRRVDDEAQRLAGVGSWEWNAVRDVVSWSPELYRIYGLQPDEPVGGYEGFLRRVHPDDRELTRNVISSAFRDGGPFACDHRIVRGDGAVRMLQTRGGAARGRGGAVVRLVGCCMDVTAQWETRRRLEESLSLLNATLDSTADGIFAIDLSGKVVICNRRALTLWNLPVALAARSDLPAMIDYVRGQLADPEAFVENERRLQADPDAKGLDTIRFKDGRIFERYTQPQRQGDRVIGRVCSFRDVTAREKAVKALKTLAAGLEQRVRERTAELRAEAEKLARSNGELEMFATAASHDLRAPLRRIAAFTELLAGRAGKKLDPAELALLGRIRAAAADMNALVADLLALSRASREQLPVEEVDLDAALAEILSILAPVLAAARGTVESTRLPKVRGQPALWRSLLCNLIGNALKFRDPGRPPRVRVGFQRSSDGGALLTIEDNGIGFTAGQAREIFRPFQRLHTSTEFEGSGIGLTICERIVERWGGRISACGEPGKGATFEILLPASALASAGPGRADPR